MFGGDSGVSILFEQCFVDRRGVFARDRGVFTLFLQCLYCETGNEV